MKVRLNLKDILSKLESTLSTAILSAVKQEGKDPATVELKRSAEARDVVELQEGSRTAVQYFTGGVRVGGIRLERIVAATERAAIRRG